MRGLCINKQYIYKKWPAVGEKFYNWRRVLQEAKTVQAYYIFIKLFSYSILLPKRFNNHLYYSITGHNKVDRRVLRVYLYTVLIFKG